MEATEMRGRRGLTGAAKLQKLPLPNPLPVSPTNPSCKIRGYAGWRTAPHPNRTRNRTVPACQNLYKNSFTYHCLQDDQTLPFDDANQFLEQCELYKSRVLVHCMSGKSRSPAIVIAYLMKSKGWRFAQSYQWVKERRPSVEINQEIHQQLEEYEQKIFGTADDNNIAISSLPSLSFGFSRPNDPPLQVPVFDSSGGVSIFSGAAFDIPPEEFTFGAE
ncbi:Protein-tyrosine-phosphatase ibr5 [Orobanche gracilis]